MLKVVVNIGIFYAAWLGIIVSQSYEYYDLCHYIAPVLFAAHLIFVAETPKVEVFILPLVAIVGFALDSSMAMVGFLEFKLPTQPAPLWLLELWFIFATTINYSMKAILERPKLAASLGFFAAPLTYLSGEYWGIVFYQQPKLLGMVIHGLIWAVLLFFMLRVYNHLYRLMENRLTPQFHQQ